MAWCANRAADTRLLSLLRSIIWARGMRRRNDPAYMEVDDLTGGRLNFGLNNLTNFGQNDSAHSATLTGTVSAS